jgi:hypothetical protein
MSALYCPSFHCPALLQLAIVDSHLRASVVDFLKFNSHEVDKSRTTVFEQVSAASDSYQVAVSTNGDLVSAMQVASGGREMQWHGQMSDDSPQQLSQARGIDVADCAPTDNAVELETEREVDKYSGAVALSVQPEIAARGPPWVADEPSGHVVRSGGVGRRGRGQK